MYVQYHSLVDALLLSPFLLSLPAFHTRWHCTFSAGDRWLCLQSLLPLGQERRNAEPCCLVRESPQDWAATDVWRDTSGCLSRRRIPFTGAGHCPSIKVLQVPLHAVQLCSRLCGAVCQLCPLHSVPRSGPLCIGQCLWKGDLTLPTKCCNSCCPCSFCFQGCS